MFPPPKPHPPSRLPPERLWGGTLAGLRYAWHAETILAQLAACGLHPDEPVVWQSQRGALYQAALDRLVAGGLAYPCACSRSDIGERPVRPGPPGAPGVPGRPPMPVAARLRAVVAATPCRIESKNLTIDVGISVGVAAWPDNADKQSALVAAADADRPALGVDHAQGVIITPHPACARDVDGPCNTRRFPRWTIAISSLRSISARNWLWGPTIRARTELSSNSSWVAWPL